MTREDIRVPCMCICLKKKKENEFSEILPEVKLLAWLPISSFKATALHPLSPHSLFLGTKSQRKARSMGLPGRDSNALERARRRLASDTESIATILHQSADTAGFPPQC